MPGGGEDRKTARKEKALERRADIRDYIRNHRDPIVKKWMALTESVQSEDAKRSHFVRRRLREDTEVPPVVIRKFIGTLRKSVHNTMRVKGGTPYSIIRNLFLYWDADKSGALKVEDLDHVMRSIGCRLSDDELRAIVAYYPAPGAQMEGAQPLMSYDELLKDILRGEPTLTMLDSDGDNKSTLRFENVEDEWAETPDCVQKFLEAFREYIAARMRNVGGTPQEHATPLFLKFDKDIKGGLTPAQLVTGTTQLLKLQMSDQQAKDIVKYYDRKFKGFLEPTLFIQDLCSGVQSMLHFSELSARQIAAKKKAIADNPFIIQPFKTKPNKVLEKFKVDALKVLDAKVYNIGGSKRGWMREAFRFWDPRDLGVLSHYTHLQGAAKRLGLTLPDEDARLLMKEYDARGNGTLDYNILIKDVVASDPHFLEDATTLDTHSLEHDDRISSRAPKPATKGIERFRLAAGAYARKSGGRLEPRDVLHGTCLRFDRRQEGRLDYNGVKSLCSELGVRLNELDLHTFIAWFDTNGSDCLDYNELVRQLYGDDVLTRPLKLPPVPSPVKEARAIITSIQKANVSPAKLGMGQSSISTLAYGYGTESRKRLNQPTKGAGGGGGGGTQNAQSMPSSPTAGADRLIGMDPKVLVQNLQTIESRATKEFKRAERRQQIMEEKVAIQLKLENIERQKKLILEDHRKAQVLKAKQMQAAAMMKRPA